MLQLLPSLGHMRRVTERAGSVKKRVLEAMHVLSVGICISAPSLAYDITIKRFLFLEREVGGSAGFGFLESVYILIFFFLFHFLLFFPRMFPCWFSVVVNVCRCHKYLSSVCDVVEALFSYLSTQSCVSQLLSDNT